MGLFGSDVKANFITLVSVSFEIFAVRSVWGTIDLCISPELLGVDLFMQLWAFYASNQKLHINMNA